MTITRFEYQAPVSLEEALSLLDKQRGKCMILAGGTDLAVQMNNGQKSPAVIVDIKNIPELNRLEWNEGRSLHIGAAVPLSKLAMFTALTEKFGILAQACSIIGSVQIRNRGTIGGNVCNAAPSADSPPPLLCLGARAIVASLAGTRAISLEDFFLSPGRTALRDDELLVEIEVPAPPTSSAGCYLRHTTREEMDIAVAGVASFLTLAPGGTKLRDARIALGAVAPVPVRAREAEQVLLGKAPTTDVIALAAEHAAKAARPISDIRGSADYRRELVKVQTRRTLKRCCESLGIEIR